MIHTNDLASIEIRSKFNSARKLVNFAITILALLAFTYFMFWVVVMTDENMLQYGENLFKPLTSLFFTNNDVYIYRNTALMLLGAIIPVFFSYSYINKIESLALDEHNKRIEKKEQKIKQKQYQESLREFEVIKNYSICLSFDYDAKEKEISQESKNTLNNILFNKIQNIFSKISFDTINIYESALIIQSSDFASYDYTYESLLKIISKLKTSIENKFPISVIPSITTDAYKKDVTTKLISDNHFDIKDFNFKNKSLSTAEFSKKYKYINKRKYIGIPIGEYVSFKKQTTGTYELNVIDKNLEKTLATI